jgi:hypothetical protein
MIGLGSGFWVFIADYFSYIMLVHFIDGGNKITWLLYD